eukprot:SAG22_NODE_937_length_6418_cov_124.858680_7_plen_192_part_00
MPGIEAGATGGGAQPFHNASDFGLTVVPEEKENYETIQGELLAYMAGAGAHGGQESFDQPPADEGSIRRNDSTPDSWTKLVLYVQNRREWTLCGGPFAKTCRLLKQLPELTDIVHNAASGAALPPPSPPAEDGKQAAPGAGYGVPGEVGFYRLSAGSALDPHTGEHKMLCTVARTPCPCAPASGMSWVPAL